MERLEWSRSGVCGLEWMRAVDVARSWRVYHDRFEVCLVHRGGADIRYRGSTCFAGADTTTWKSTEAAGTRQGSFTGALEIEMKWGHPLFGAEGSIGLGGTDLDSPYLESRRIEGLMLFTLTGGISLSPFGFARRGHFQIRPDLGVAAILPITAGCDECPDDGIETAFGARIKVGLDVYFIKGGGGVSVDFLLNFVTLGDVDEPVAPDPVEISAPLVMVRIAFVGRDL